MHTTAFLKRGFTLFELLVSISIIGLLMALATVSFTTAQQSGRDSRRRGDIKGMSNALEQYYAVNSAYPDNDCPANAVVSVLPNGLPTDPRTGLDYTISCTPTAYCLCAELEREGSGNSTTTDCTAMNPGGDYFCAQSLQ